VSGAWRRLGGQLARWRVDIAVRHALAVVLISQQAFRRAPAPATAEPSGE
jgi:Flp pilus assembly protein TadD